MNALVLFTIILPTIEMIMARPQQPQIEPAYLRDYYAQLSQQNPNAIRGSVQDVTPIFEQNTSFQPSPQVSVGQQIRVRDPVQEQIRVQQPQYSVPTSVRQYTQQQQPQYQPQYQQQHIQYNRPQTPTKQTLAIPRKPQIQQYQSQRDPEEQEEEENEGNSSYQFGFDVKDDEYTNYQQRKEVRDGNVIKGSYSVVDSDGFIRTVTYTADPKEGFKADVVRQPTDIVVKVPTPAPENSIGKLSRPQPHFLPQQSQYRQQAQRQQQQQQQHQQHQQQQQQQIRQPIQVQPEYE
ncbi:myb-like protein AA [Contarinia nasturtii]|uniref:myb-like protein AA n=1 Tax=Contarinia nasturtii TaxID=265458 RepID=UPI0012D46E13|nr:myb-like protein AA [Contarinia nasturtii]